MAISFLKVQLNTAKNHSEMPCGTTVKMNLLFHSSKNTTYSHERTSHTHIRTYCQLTCCTMLRKMSSSSTFYSVLNIVSNLECQSRDSHSSCAEDFTSSRV
jgi:hypothetical protein